MKYTVTYTLVSDTGYVRGVNQDNWILGERYLFSYQDPPIYPLRGTLRPGEKAVLGVFDGMGGGTRGEMASYLAAKTAAEHALCDAGEAELEELCQQENRAVCAWAEEERITVTGSTAVVLGFGGETIALCNIGDSKAFLFAGGELRQISVDHVCSAPPGKKAPLSQCLGIPEDEMIIEPYTASMTAREGDVYLLCSDGLTDMVTLEEITELLTVTPFEQSAEVLTAAALRNGGKDNVTVLLCRIGDHVAVTLPPELPSAATDSGPDVDLAPTASAPAPAAPRAAETPKASPAAAPAAKAPEVKDAASAPKVAAKAFPVKQAAIIGAAVLALIMGAVGLLGRKKPAPVQAAVPAPAAEPVTVPTSAPTSTPAPTPEPTPEPAVLSAGGRYSFGSYEQDNNLADGPENIEWRVLEVRDGRALLLSEYALESRRYNDIWEEITWENCTLRTWLNGEFLTAAFTAEELAQIVLPDAPGDRVFLLNTEELQCFTADDATGSA